ncbi:ABC transporter transmembrane domain-containing protein [Lacibacterium aquatile]|uniref:ABC transporter transmembrane domain-containing protein n=1 Tax=Lacibacterium aquatile TaxID=1168082 RepID=A0ABW5DRE0_9PROT
MQKSLFSFILKFSLKQQIIILALTGLSFPFLYYSLDLPKQIINEAIQGKDFPKEFLGYSLGQIEYLAALSGIFLALVFINGWFKYFINVYKGRVGERMLRRLRYDLYGRILRFPLFYFRRTPPGQLIPIITSEVENVGGFVGDSFAVPAFQGGTLLTILVFMCMQDPILGAAAIALYPFQIYVIPKLQRKVNNLSKQRIRLVRDLSDRINETALSLREIRAHGTDRYHLADFSARLSKNYWIRFEIYKWKFFVKFLNNFLAQLTPFFFYSIGGYLVIKGNLSIGALLAVIAAYKDLNAPWRELLDFYQQMEDARIKYQQVIEQFNPAGMLVSERAGTDGQGEPSAPEPLAAVGVTSFDDNGTRVLDGLNLEIPAGTSMAILGPYNGGKHELAQILSGLVEPQSGCVQLGGVDMADLPLGQLNRRLAYVGSETILASGTVFDNLIYGLQVQPQANDLLDQAARLQRERERAEAEMTGNSPDDIESDWIDYPAAGAEARSDLLVQIIQILRDTELLPEMREYGLRGRADPVERPDIAELVLEVRKVLRAPLSQPKLRAYVELFDKDSFNNQASLAENLLFGAPVGPVFQGDALGKHPFVLSILKEIGLYPVLVEAGRETARQMIEIFKDLPAGHEFYNRFSFISAEELTELNELESKLARGGALSATIEANYIALALRLVPTRHRLDVVDDDLRAGIVKARHRLGETLPETLQPSVEFFNIERYNGALTLLDNMLFGRLAPGQGGAESRMRQMIRDELEKADLLGPLLEKIIDVGLHYPAGVAGGNLSPSVRQRLALARALIKRPNILVLDDPLASQETALQTKMVANLLARSDMTIIWVLQRGSLARSFERAAVIEEGRVLEEGDIKSLGEASSHLSKYLNAD